MSIATGTGDMSESDYSDYEHQQHNCQWLFSPDGSAESNFAVALRRTFDPLESQGGLANNEVAELVHLTIAAYQIPEFDTADQNQISAMEQRGVVGTDLDGTNLFENEQTKADEPIDIVETTGDNLEEGDYGPKSNDQSSPEVFGHFENPGFVGFNDTAASTAAGGNYPVTRVHYPMRELYGRGPVLGAEDSLNVISKTIADNSVVSIDAVVRTHWVWDIATVDDAGERFAVPTDD